MGVYICVPTFGCNWTLCSLCCSVPEASVTICHSLVPYLTVTPHKLV